MFIKRSKYGAKKTEVDWIKFDSKIEADYYVDLKKLKEEWTVLDFQLQPKYVLLDKFVYRFWDKKVMALKYVADFEVFWADWSVVVVDIKWMPTETAKIKRKLFMHKYPDTDLQWVVKYRGERVNYDDNEKRKKENRKAKKKLLNDKKENANKI